MRASQGTTCVKVRALLVGSLMGIELGDVTTGELEDCIGVEGALVALGADATGRLVKS